MEITLNETPKTICRQPSSASHSGNVLDVEGEEANVQ